LTIPVRRFHWRVGTVALVSLAWRIVYVWRWKASDSDLTDEGDAFYYSAQAAENAAGHLFRRPFTGGPAADHPPMTALLVTPVSWLDHHAVLAQRGVMVLVGTAAVVVIALVAREVAGDGAGIIAAVLAGAYAPLWMNDGLVMAEAPAALLVALLLLIGTRLYDEVTTRRVLAFGAVAGLAVLTRAELALLFPLLLAPPLVRATRLPPRVRWQSLGWAALAAVAVTAPWIGWNLARFDEPTLVSTNDGLTLLGANCESTYYTRAIGFWDIQCALDHHVEGDPSVESAEWRRRGIAYAADHLGRVPKVVTARIGRVWGVYEPGQMVSLNTGEGRETWASWIAMYQSWVAMPVAVAGAVVLHRRRRPLAPFVATAVTVTAVAVLFYGIVRFRVPADVATVVLVAVAADAALRGGGPEPARAGSSRPGEETSW
jgi:4-amino-4-deoxy-L-arabinose transferase-like glycosyltransferase